MRRLVVLGLLFNLAGCLTTGKRGGDTPLSVHDFGSPGERLVAVRPAPLAVEVRAPAWFDALAVNYRLAYGDPSRVREYARSRWAGPPTQLIQQRLVRQLDLLPAGQGRAACVLRVDLGEFSQIFATPGSSRGVLQGRALWLDRGRAVLAERDIDIAVTAGTPDALGGVAALSAAVGQLTATLHAWELELAQAGRLKGCTP